MSIESVNENLGFYFIYLSKFHFFSYLLTFNKSIGSKQIVKEKKITTIGSPLQRAGGALSYTFLLLLSWADDLYLN